MARIPEDELERLKREVSLQRLVEAKGVVLQRRGADLVGCCPFHDDREPSLVVTPASNLWHCLGACQMGGSVVDWVMRTEGVSFRHAVELLRADPSLVATPGLAKKVGTVPKLPSPVEVGAEDAELLAQVVGYYHSRLREEQAALKYLESRGLGSADLIDRFRLGYADRTLGLRLPEKNRKAGAEMRSALQRVGIIRESGHEHFNGSVVVPIFDAAGNVVEMYGRKVRQDLRADIPRHLYLPGPHRGVWNREGVMASGGEVILCEALIDAMTFWAQGYENVTASYGTEGFTADHLALFAEAGMRRVLIAYDSDAAGDKAAVQVAVRLTGKGMDCFRVRFPKGLDANAYAVEELTTASRRLGDVIRKAVWLGQGKAPMGVRVDLPTPREEPVSPPPSPVVAPVAEPAPDPPLAASSPRVASSPEPATPELKREPVPARVVPLEVPVEMEAEAAEEGVVLSFGDRRWRARGLERNTSFDSLKVNLQVHREGGGFHVDTLDLYSSRARQVFIRQVADELRLPEEAVKREVGRVLLELEKLVEERIRKAQEPKVKPVQLSSDEEGEALELLRDPELLERIVADLDRLGVVGEETNKLVAYLAATSRKLDRPLAVMVQSTSGAGKSALLSAVLELVPEEERVRYSAVTGQALYYLGERDLEHKVLAVEEEAGAEKAAYALKLLQSEGELSIASTGKDPQTGRLMTEEYRVRGPVSIFLTTTSVEVDEELLNRCLVLSVDEEREQTRAILARQREAETLEGLRSRAERERIVRRHRNAQRLLRPVLVANPFARQLTFADERTRSRRDHRKYLTLIRAVALLHQHQRPLRTAIWDEEQVAYIEVTRRDIELAHRLAHQVLGHCLDELPPGSRRLLLVLDELVSAECRSQGLERCEYRFSRRELRERLGWGDTQLKVHLARLVDHEYLRVSRLGTGFSYELAWEGQGQDGGRFLVGLRDPQELDDHPYDSQRSGSEEGWSPSGRPSVGAWSGAGRGEDSNVVRVERLGRRANRAAGNSPPADIAVGGGQGR